MRTAGTLSVFATIHEVQTLPTELWWAFATSLSKNFESKIINVEDLKKKQQQKTTSPKMHFYSTKNGVLSDNFSSIYFDNSRITKST